MLFLNKLFSENASIDHNNTIILFNIFSECISD